MTKEQQAVNEGKRVVGVVAAGGRERNADETYRLNKLNEDGYRELVEGNLRDRPCFGNFMNDIPRRVSPCKEAEHRGSVPARDVRPRSIVGSAG